MISRAQAEFNITSNQLSPIEITNSIGITPTLTWQSGDFIQKTKLRRKQNGWRLSSNEDDFVKSIKLILAIMSPKSEVIRKLCGSSDIKLELSCAIYIVENEEIPAVSFDQGIISGLAKLNATLDIDIIRTK
jgi:hypothetical protein